MRVLFTGGSGCGKSSYAERMACALPLPRYYLATMANTGTDEFTHRIARHRAMRKDKGFISIEKQYSVGDVQLEDGACVLLECLCNLTANELFDQQGKTDHSAYSRIFNDIAMLEQKAANLLVVTNDVSSGSALNYSPSTDHYVQVLSKLNRELAARFDVVYELVCGIPLRIKGAPWAGGPK